MSKTMTVAEMREGEQKIDQLKDQARSLDQTSDTYQSERSALIEQADAIRENITESMKELEENQEASERRARLAALDTSSTIEQVEDGGSARAGSIPDKISSYRSRAAEYYNSGSTSVADKPVIHADGFYDAKELESARSSVRNFNTIHTSKPLASGGPDPADGLGPGLGYTPTKEGSYVSRLYEQNTLLELIGMDVVNDGWDTTYPIEDSEYLPRILPEGRRKQTYEPAFLTATISMFKMAGVYFQTHEWIRDAWFDAEGAVNTQLARGFGRSKTQYAIAGSGSGEPLGFLNDTDIQRIGNGGVYDEQMFLDALKKMPAYAAGSYIICNYATMCKLTQLDNDISAGNRTGANLLPPTMFGGLVTRVERELPDDVILVGQPNIAAEHPVIRQMPAAFSDHYKFVDNIRTHLQEVFFGFGVVQPAAMCAIMPNDTATFTIDSLGIAVE